MKKQKKNVTFALLNAVKSKQKIQKTWEFDMDQNVNNNCDNSKRKEDCAMKDRKLADTFMPLAKAKPIPKKDERLQKRGKNVSHEADSLLDELIRLVKERKEEKTDKLSKLNFEVTKLTNEVKKLNTQLSSLKKH